MLYKKPKEVVFKDDNLEYWIGLEEKDGLYSPYLFHHEDGLEQLDEEMILIPLDGSQIRSGKWFIYEAAIHEGYRMYIRFLSKVIKDGELVDLVTK